MKRIKNLEYPWIFKASFYVNAYTVKHKNGKTYVVYTHDFNDMQWFLSKLELLEDGLATYQRIVLTILKLGKYFRIFQIKTENQRRSRFGIVVECTKWNSKGEIMTVDCVTEMKISVDTEPCPYCGGEGIVGCSYVDLWSRMCDWFVECAECGATNINPTRGYSTEEAAIKAWNTRC